MRHFLYFSLTQHNSVLLVNLGQPVSVYLGFDFRRVRMVTNTSGVTWDDGNAWGFISLMLRGLVMKLFGSTTPIGIGMFCGRCWIYLQINRRLAIRNICQYFYLTLYPLSTVTVSAIIRGFAILIQFFQPVDTIWLVWALNVTWLPICYRPALFDTVSVMK